MKKLLLKLNFYLMGTYLMCGSDQALQDLDTMYQTILANHPGPHNQKDPDFTKKMNKAYLQTKILCDECSTQQNAFDLLKSFAQ